jgi:hypothetical protein
MRGLLDAGGDINTVRILAGQVPVATISQCARRVERVQRQAAAILRVPYVGSTRTQK